MGYDLHIHRAEDWLDAAEAPISESEWLALADSDPELAREGSYLTDRAELPVFVFAGEGASFMLDPADGAVTVTGAQDLASRVKAVALAGELGARVQGDDGELYGPDGEPLAEPEPPKRGLFGRLFGR